MLSESQALFDSLSQFRAREGAAGREIDDDALALFRMVLEETWNIGSVSAPTTSLAALVA